MHKGYFYANIDLSLVQIPAADRPFRVPCGCPHCGHSQDVPIARSKSLVDGRVWRCVNKECAQEFLVDIDKATAEVPAELMAPNTAIEERYPDLDFDFAAA